ncbi:alpha-E domain-containing protein [Sulfobacillus thermosulfidooxidans]|uniref:alpha-E domain-containing protein n=1 Tax=Sulfobacillus thermosulfidooxidans TaxID=28034 RepID=UPI000B269DBA|nr:alpha-E domain-containing protein [Sulfobacillus thermosulfidooxidans]
MLSRVADDVYWMARYVERAQNFARILAIRKTQSAQMITRERWGDFLRVFGDPHARDGEEPSSILRHVICDAACPISLCTNIKMARDNARMARDMVSPEMWQILTRMQNTVSGQVEDIDDESWEDLLSQVTMDALTFQSLLVSTILQDEAYHFMMIGTMLERALSTLRLLLSYCGTLSLWDNEPLYAVNALKSVTGYGAFRRAYRKQLHVPDVIQFLLFEPAFPRSVVCAGSNLLRELQALPEPGGTPRLLAGRVFAQLSYDTMDLVMEATPEVYVRRLITQFEKIHDGLTIRYFQPEVQEV